MHKQTTNVGKGVEWHRKRISQQITLTEVLFMEHSLCHPHIHLQISAGIQSLLCTRTGYYLRAGLALTKVPWYVCTRKLWS